jgi:hypothetical protein
MSKIKEIFTTETAASLPQNFLNQNGESGTGPTRTRSKAILLYGCLYYLIFLAAFLYAIGFLADLFPRSMDSMGTPFRWSSIWIDLAWLAVSSPREQNWPEWE